MQRLADPPLPTNYSREERLRRILGIVYLLLFKSCRFHLDKLGGSVELLLNVQRFALGLREVSSRSKALRRTVATNLPYYTQRMTGGSSLGLALLVVLLCSPRVCVTIFQVLYVRIRNANVNLGVEKLGRSCRPMVETPPRWNLSISHTH